MGKDKPWQSVNKYSGPTNEEMTMIRDYVLLPHMQTMVLRSIEELEYSTDLLLKQLHLESANLLLKSIDKDYYSLRAELKMAGIKILFDDEHQTHDGVLFYSYVCRGYQSRFGIMREVAKAEISVRLAKYIHELLAKLLGDTHNSATRQHTLRAKAQR